MAGQGNSRVSRLRKQSPPGKRPKVLPLKKLKPPLKAIPDDTTQGGTSGHFAIAPVDEKGEVDVKKLEAWATWRGTGEKHEYTQILLDAVVEPNAEGSTQ